MSWLDRFLNQEDTAVLEEPPRTATEGDLFPAATDLVRSEPKNIISSSNAMAVIDSITEALGIAGMQYSPPVNISPELALKNCIVYACCRLISGAIAQVPLQMYERNSEGQRNRILPEIEYLMNVSPTEGWSASQWKEYMVTSVLLRGDSFTWIIRDSLGVPIMLQPLDPNSILDIERLDDGSLEYTVGYSLNATKLTNWIKIQGYNMLHVSNYGFNGKRAPSTIASGANQGLVSAISADNYSNKLWKSGALKTLMITLEAESTQEDRVRLAQALKDAGFQGIDTAGQPVIVGGGATPHSLDMSPSDIELLESRKYSEDMIMSSFGVPSYLLQRETKTTSFGSGLAEISASLLRFTLMPHLKRIEEECSIKFALNRRQFVDANTMAIERGSYKETVDIERKELGGQQVSGSVSVNEIRERKGMKRLDDPAADRVYIANPNAPLEVAKFNAGEEDDE